MPADEERAEATAGASQSAVPSPKSGKSASQSPFRRRLVIASALYALCTVIFAIAAGERLERHTMNNHFAVQAEVWRAGRWYLTEEDISARARRMELDMHNDWAVVDVKDPATKRVVERRYFNSFPVFPALVMYPFVAIAGSALMFRDALFCVIVAGLSPALLFLALERLRDQARSERTERQNAMLALLSAIGTVFFFTSVQGTVWFAAHVVAAALLGGYLLSTLAADRLRWCFLAGVFAGCLWHTRVTAIWCVVLFAYEAIRVSLTAPIRSDGTLAERAGDLWNKIDKRALATRYVVFALPIVFALWVTLRINAARFGNPTEFGHTLLNVVWMERVKRYGLFSYHYLSRNLTCAFTLLPVVNPTDAPEYVGRYQVSGNGLALWFTTPLYLWLLWPKKTGALHWALWLTVLPIALMDLLYHNSGWVQFGYRFSNDYAPFLFILLAIGARPMGLLWNTAAAWSIGINTFGAVSFDRQAYRKYYFLQTYTVPIYDGKMGVESSTYAPD
jgi:hypothetical protein